MLNNKIDNNFKEDLEEFIGSRVDRVGLSPSRERRNANKEAVKLFSRLMENVPAELRKDLHDLDEAYNWAQVLDEEACYKQGVQDGIKLALGVIE